MEENLDSQKSPASTPPASEVTIRTMESDIKSIEQGGGELTPPKIFSVEGPEIKAKLNIPGYVGPEKSIFAPATAIGETEPQPGSAWWRIFGIVAVILIVCAVLGLLGYFVIFPWLFPKVMPPVPILNEQSE